MAWGEKDFFKPFKGYQLLEEGIVKYGAVHIAKGCGHHLYFDDPEATMNSLLTTFFEIE